MNNEEMLAAFKYGIMCVGFYGFLLLTCFCIMLAIRSHFAKITASADYAKVCALKEFKRQIFLVSIFLLVTIAFGFLKAIFKY